MESKSKGKKPFYPKDNNQDVTSFLSSAAFIVDEPEICSHGEFLQKANFSGIWDRNPEQDLAHFL